MLRSIPARLVFLTLANGVFFSTTLSAQPPGPGGPGGPNSRGDLKLVAKFDKDGDGVLSAEERVPAREELKNNPPPRRGPRGGSREREPGTPGPTVNPSDVRNYPDASLYDPNILRTLFLEFENDDWEKELAEFKPTDVEVPATLTVDGKAYPNVGVSFRGASSFFMIPEGLKRSLNLSMDLVDKDQRLYGYKSLNLLNCNGDASMMSSLLYSSIGAQRIPTPKVNFVKVVINGESWGLYANSQQFNNVFVKEHFGTSKGARWKVPGSPRGDGGLRFVGEDIDPYRERFEIKSKDRDKSWHALMELCRVLNETPADQLEEEIGGMLDLDGVLWFLAVDIALVNSDGYWTRASDYNIYQDQEGKFHILPHDMNEAFRSGRGGPRGGGGRSGGQEARGGRGRATEPPPTGGNRPPGGGDNAQTGSPPRQQAGGRGQRRGGGGFGRAGGVDLDPLHGLDDTSKPLRSKLLANDKLRTRYLQHVRTIAEQLAWSNLGPQVKQMRELLEHEVAADTRKLMTTEAFLAATSDELPPDGQSNLRSFAERRSAYLLAHEAIRALPAEPVRIFGADPASTKR